MGLNTIRTIIKPNKKIVLCGGVFDLIHPGHIHFLNKARKLGDFLVVVIATKKRGKERKLLNTAEKRAMVVASLKPVDLVVIGHKGDILDIVEEIRPHVIALGPDQKFNEVKMRKNLKDRGLKTKVIRIKSKLKGSSTTSLMKKSKKIKL